MAQERASSATKRAMLSPPPRAQAATGAGAGDRTSPATKMARPSPPPRAPATTAAGKGDRAPPGGALSSAATRGRGRRRRRRGPNTAGDEDGGALSSSAGPRRRRRRASARDRLSALDDATLHAILARLPLRDAAATAALSRRWPRVFATLPRLLLRPASFNRRGFPDGGDEDCCEDAARWWRSLSRLLDHRAAPVTAFDVEFRFTRQHGEWSRGVFRDLSLSGGLLELSIANTNFAECYTLPSPVYTCQTLTSLDLYNCRLQIPSKITGLRTVRSLRLRNVVIEDAGLRRMISRCSAMESLVIHDVHKARSIFIRAPCLEKLEIYSYRPLCISLSKAVRLDTVRLGFSYGYPEYSWSINDTLDTDEDQPFCEIKELPDYKKMADREHKQTDEVKNMTKFLSGLSCAKQLRLYLSTEFSEVLSMAKVSMQKLLSQKSCLLELTTLALTLDYNHEVLATLVSCLLNSSPNLKHLTIIELRHPGSPVPLAAAFWKEQIKGDHFLNHLSTVNFYTDSLFEIHPCGGLCRFLVMHAKVLKKMSIEYHRSLVKPEHVAKLEAVRRNIHLWPRASGDVLLELYPVDRCPCF
ncbi:hypothetical protein EJB05_02313, partial [Eragrostis curvula]